MVKLAEFVEKLKTTPDGDGTLLDSSLVYFGAGMSNGLLHDRHNVPAALIGGANGRLHGNRHIEATVDRADVESACLAWPTCSAPRSRRSASPRAASRSNRSA